MTINNVLEETDLVTMNTKSLYPNILNFDCIALAKKVSDNFS